MQYCSFPKIWAIWHCNCVKVTCDIPIFLINGQWHCSFSEKWILQFIVNKFVGYCYVLHTPMYTPIPEYDYFSVVLSNCKDRWGIIIYYLVNVHHGNIVCYVKITTDTKVWIVVSKGQIIISIYVSFMEWNIMICC